MRCRSLCLKFLTARSRIMPKVLIPLTDGCVELEAVTVIDLLRRAGVDVISAGLGSHGEAVRASRGVLLIPATDLDDALTRGGYDMVVLPGGLPGAEHLHRDSRSRALLQRINEDHKHLAAICAAPKVLADAGLLQGRPATSYPDAHSAAQRAGVKF